MKIIVEVPDQHVANLIDSINLSDPVTASWVRGFTPGFILRVTEDDEKSRVFAVAPQQQIEALGLMASEYPAQFKDVMVDNADAGVADLFLQLCCFGEEKYS